MTRPSAGPHGFEKRGKCRGIPMTRNGRKTGLCLLSCTSRPRIARRLVSPKVAASMHHGHSYS